MHYIRHVTFCPLPPPLTSVEQCLEGAEVTTSGTWEQRMVERAAWPDVRGRSRPLGVHSPARKRPPVSRHACGGSLGRKRGVSAPVSNLDREVDCSARGRHEAGHERPASREDAGVELRCPEKGWSRPPAARVLCRGRSPLVVEPTATQVPAKVMTKRNSQRLVPHASLAQPSLYGTYP